MKMELRQGEMLVKNGPANLQKNIEAVGGRLYLTNQRLVFEPHKFNVQGGITEIALANIRSAEKCWTKFLGVLPLFPNSLAILTKEGQALRFVLSGRGAWLAALETLKGNTPSGSLSSRG